MLEKQKTNPDSWGHVESEKSFFFDFLKVHNELGKVTKFETSKHLFSWRNSHLEKVRAQSAPPPLGFSDKGEIL